MKYKYIIWDWNGTILDDLQINYEIANNLLENRGLPVIANVEEYREHFDFPIIDYYKYLGFDLENEKFELVAREYVFGFDERFPEIEIFPDAEKVVRSLKYKTSQQIILSQTEHRLLEKQVRFHEIEHLFSEIIGAGDVYAKGKQEMALRWITANDIDCSDVLMISDTVHDYEVACTVGCDCVLISRGHNSKRRLLETGARVFDNLEEFEKWVTQ